MAGVEHAPRCAGWCFAWSVTSAQVTLVARTALRPLLTSVNRGSVSLACLVCPARVTRDRSTPVVDPYRASSRIRARSTIRSNAADTKMRIVPPLFAFARSASIRSPGALRCRAAPCGRTSTAKRRRSASSFPAASYPRPASAASPSEVGRVGCDASTGSPSTACARQRSCVPTVRSMWLPPKTIRTCSGPSVEAAETSAS